MPAIIDTVYSHVQKVMEEAMSQAAMAKLFNMTQTNKGSAPLESFIEYYAFKAEERKFLIRYPKQIPHKNIIKDPLNQPIPIHKAYQAFVTDSRMP